MRQEIINLYKFEELSEESQQKAIENNIDINVDYEWSEYSIEQWKERLHMIGFENAEIRFSGFSSQGSGASFTSDIDLEKIINTLAMCGLSYSNYHKYNALERMEYHGLIDIQAEVRRTSNHYVHENTCTVHHSFDYYHDTGLTDTQFNNIEGIAQDFIEEIEYLRSQLSQEIYYDLRKEYEWRNSDEQVKESLIANEYEFTADGEIY